MLNALGVAAQHERQIGNRPYSPDRLLSYSASTTVGIRMTDR